MVSSSSQYIGPITPSRPVFRRSPKGGWNASAVLSSFGEKDKRARLVVRDLIRSLQTYLASSAPVDEHLADQLMLPMALLAGGTFRASGATPHLRTNAEVLTAFLPGCVAIAPEENRVWRVSCHPRT